MDRYSGIAQLFGVKMNDPMLLTHYNPSIFNKGKVYISEKYDGWRMMYRDGKFYTRRGNEIALPKKFYKAMRKHDHVFDGELWLGYETTSTDITSNTDFGNANFMIFDIPSIDGDFKTRYETLKEMTFSIPGIKVVRQIGCWTKEFMNKYYKRVVKRGGEGIVIRPATHMYKYGVRDHLFQKLKPESTLDAMIVGYFNTAKGKKLKDYVSSLIVCSTEDKKEFKVSFKSTNPPKLGTIITVRYNQKTSNGLPKFPVFLGIRDDLDLTEESLNLLKERKRSNIITETVVDLENPNCDGIITKTECEDSPPRKIVPGRHIYYDNEAGRKYRITCDRAGKTVYCSCEAWKYQILPAAFRTCKHCIMIFDFQPKVPWEVRNASKRKHEEKRNL